ncbi:NUDIX domain-containing protein [Candidatus Dojkabacteria bacterium]|uniref:NUDIX domain-containing protein n=1 Tax=Candidatus Dojkabacteria bacterium TaxID=2099670 RepID=A0A955RKS1_9BACT|nr:NUDIX domain-containing protein [Candidatus Dojkabacteria bacterium]
MTDEYLHKMTEVGEKRGKILRKDAHQKGICHSTVHIWVITAQGDILLQKRAKQKKQFADCYHMAIAGHVSYPDTSVETVKKESMEELGLEIDTSKLIHLFSFHEALVVPETGETDNEYRDIYVYIVDSKDQLGSLELQESEVQGLEWVTLKDFAEGIENETLYKQMLPHAKSYYLRVVEELQRYI